MSVTLIMPCAGKSTRFNLSKPKWMLTHPNGNLMLMESIFGLDVSNVSKIIITVVKNHIETSKIDLKKIIEQIEEKANVKVEFLILDEFTNSQSETVYRTIKNKKITGAIFIKDCDNYFHHSIKDKNEICISELQDGINAVNKSYVYLNKLGHLSGIVEKQVISNKFCVGGYSFTNANLFIKFYEEVNNLNQIDIKEIYISHIIQQMLLSNENFEISLVNQYHDWGTLEEWYKYKARFKTYFIDIDGVICKNGAEYFEPQWGKSEGLLENIKTINSLYDNNSYIILTTARKEKYKQETIDQLTSLGLKYHNIIFGLLHSERILINDYSNTNPYPSAVAINLNRNSDTLYELLGDL